MDKVFEIIDKTGRKIYLSRERWKHITTEHSKVTIEHIEKTIVNPQKIIPHKDPVINDYYSYFKNRKERSKYLKTVVKYLNGNGFIITAYFIRHMR